LASHHDQLVQKRLDRHLENVIIDEDAIKQFPLKYYAQKLPSGLTKENYKRSMAMPLGAEFNSWVAHEELIRPKVTIKVGEVIQPLQQKIDQSESYVPKYDPNLYSKKRKRNEESQSKS